MKKFYRSIAFKHWHHFDKTTGTAIRWSSIGTGLIGIQVCETGVRVGLWWYLKFDLVAVHPNVFAKPSNPC